MTGSGRLMERYVGWWAVHPPTKAGSCSGIGRWDSRTHQKPLKPPVVLFEPFDTLFETHGRSFPLLGQPNRRRNHRQRAASRPIAVASVQQFVEW
jgi:hypothetical protein